MKDLFFRTIRLRLKWPTITKILSFINFTTKAPVGFGHTAKNVSTTVPPFG
jgi:hypothetical protein